MSPVTYPPHDCHDAISQHWHNNRDYQYVSCGVCGRILSYKHLVEHVREQAAAHLISYQERADAAEKERDELRKKIDALQELGFAAVRAEILNAQRIFMAERHLWQAIARTASKWHIDMAELTVRLAEARAAGLTWEEET